MKVIPPAVAAILHVASTPRFRLTLWDLVFDDPDGPGRTFKTAFDTGVTARQCFAQYSGISPRDLTWEGDENAGSLRCAETGHEAARYRFDSLG